MLWLLNKKSAYLLSLLALLITFEDALNIVVHTIFINVDFMAN